MEIVGSSEASLVEFEEDLHISKQIPPCFSSILPTTFGMGGAFKNIHFHEAQLINIIVPNDIFVLAKCNFGEVKLPGFSQPAPNKAKSTRGRKRKPPVGIPRKPRKIQGTGQCFNSSVLIWTRSATFPHVIYKYKVFRTGQFGLPGIKPWMIRDIVSRTRELGDYLARTIASAPAGIGHPDADGAIVALSPIMKNYKWARILTRAESLDLRAVAERIYSDETAPFAIDYIRYGCEDVKLAVKFFTPIPGNDQKTLRVNVFPRGKINILGAFDTAATRKICLYLSLLLASEEYVVRTSIFSEGVIGSVHLPDNIEPMPERDAQIWLHRLRFGYSPEPCLSADEYRALYEVLLNKKVDDNKHQHKHKALNANAVRRRVSPVDRAVNARKHAINKDVAANEHK